MKWNKRRSFAAIVLIGAFAVYVFVLQRNAHEREFRTLQLNDNVNSADHVMISITVAAVNPATRQLTSQLSFKVYGKSARDEVTPSADLKLLVNNLGVQQEFVFPKGTRMRSVEAVFPLEGELNRYPFDRYETSLQFLMTTRGHPSQIPAPQAPKATAAETLPQPANLEPTDVASNLSQSEPTNEKSSNVVGATSHSHELAISEADLENSVPVPISVDTLASIPGIKFAGSVSRSGDPIVTTVNLNLTRPGNLIVVSVLVMVGMMALALSVFVMALKASASEKKVDYLPLSLAISLIFGLPALRNIQPSVPPVGALEDYFSFIWAEMLVAVSAIIAIWTWLVRYDRA